MNALHRIGQVLATSLLVLCVAVFPSLAATPPGMAPNAAAPAVAIPVALKNSPELAKLLRDWDDQSVLAMEVARQSPTRVLNRSAMDRTQVQTLSGTRIELGRLFERTFTAQRALQQQMQRIPASALVGPPVATEAVVDVSLRPFGHSFARVLAHPQIAIPVLHPVAL